MRITIVTGPLFPVPPLQGGATAHIWMGLAEQFVRAGHPTTVVCATHPKQPSSELVSGVRFERIGGFQQSGLLVIDILKDLLYSLEVTPRLPAGDVLLINDFWLSVFAPLVKRWKGKVLTIVGRYPKGQYRFFPGVDRIVVPSKAIANALLAQTPNAWKKLVLIPHPVDTEVFSPDRVRNADSTVILYVGRVHPEKGIDLLIDAFRMVEQHSSHCSLQIVGPHDKQSGGGGSSYLNSLKERAKGLSVEFCGAVYDRHELARRYQKADLFCYPSLAEKGEAFGLAPLEAMSCGVVPIVSSLECFRDHVVSGRTGLIFEHRHSNAAKYLGETILALLPDHERREELAHGARQKALEHSFERIAQMFIDDFKGILES